jgi:hypothetical protein
MKRPVYSGMEVSQKVNLVILIPSLRTVQNILFSKYVFEKVITEAENFRFC